MAQDLKVQKFFVTLTDLSFKKFVTPQLASSIYILGIVVAAISSLFLLSVPFGFLVAPLIFVASVIFLRCGLELLLAVFQIARYSAEVARRGRPAGAEEITDRPTDDPELAV